ncbi:MAG: DinB family protein [Vicinamibacteria bacterium]
MTSELQRLEDQLRRAFEGEAWHGPSVLEALEGVSAQAAAVHPVSGAHSIWELALHLTGAYGLVLRRLDGDPRQLSAEEDWPVAPAPTEENWGEIVRRLRRLNQELRRRVLTFSPERLDAPLVPGAPYTAYTQFIGVTQHDLYHAGQVVLLKRALGVPGQKR